MSSVLNKGDSLISVIVPVFNIEEYLPKCIESIMGQSYKNLQIILVDDGSTDTSGEICDGYAEKDDRIQVIHKENAGPVSSRNAGLDIAEGDYVGFVDGDDYIDEGFYETLLQDMVKNDVDFVHTGFKEEQGNSTLVCDDFKTIRCELSKELKLDFIGGIFGQRGAVQLMPSIWSKLFKREFIRKCHAKVPSELSYGEDLLCLSICLLEGQSVYLHNAAMYHYVRRQGSLTGIDYTSTIIKISELHQALKSLLIQYGEYEGLRPYIERFIAGSVLNTGKKLGKGVGDISYYFLNNIDLIQKKRLVIYGAGSVGQGYYLQISRYASCKIVGWVDQNYQKYDFDYVEVQPVTRLSEWQYDMILIAVKDKNKAEQIRRELVEQRGIADELILWEEPGYILKEID